MTLLTILSALASAGALAAIGVADPKRRRTRGLSPATAPRRGAALGTLALCGVGMAASAGPAGVVVWASAVTAAGWALASGLARLPPPSALVVGTRDRKPALRGIALPAALPLVALLCALLTLEGRRGTGPDSASSERVAALGLLDRIDRGATAREAAAPCLAALAAVRGPSSLRGLLSDRATTLAVTGSGDAGAELQRCILAAGSEGADVARDGATSVYALDADTAARVHALILAPLDAAEAVAALVPPGGVGAGLLCRRLAEAAGPGVAALVEALRRDRAYGEAADLLERLPALDRLVAARRTGVPCPA